MNYARDLLEKLKPFKCQKSKYKAYIELKDYLERMDSTFESNREYIDRYVNLRFENLSLREAIENLGLNVEEEIEKANERIGKRGL